MSGVSGVRKRATEQPPALPIAWISREGERQAGRQGRRQTGPQSEAMDSPWRDRLVQRLILGLVRKYGASLESQTCITSGLRGHTEALVQLRLT